MQLLGLAVAVICFAATFSSCVKDVSELSAAITSAAVGGRTGVAIAMACPTCGFLSRRCLAAGVACAACATAIGGPSRRPATASVGITERTRGVGSGFVITITGVAGITTNVGYLTSISFTEARLGQKSGYGTSVPTTAAFLPTSSVCAAKARPSICGRPFLTTPKRRCVISPTGGCAICRMSARYAGCRRISAVREVLAKGVTISCGSAFMGCRVLPIR